MYLDSILVKVLVVLPLALLVCIFMIIFGMDMGALLVVLEMAAEKKKIGSQIVM
jgi:cytochrome bd-type quinol oxidase subunit 2